MTDLPLVNREIYGFDDYLPLLMRRKRYILEVEWESLIPIFDFAFLPFSFL